MRALGRQPWTVDCTFLSTTGDIVVVTFVPDYVDGVERCGGGS